jgi:hypothetical protein
MDVPKLSDLANDAENQFQLALGPTFRVASNEVLGESQARGGFRLCFADGSREIVVAYGDLQIEVTLNGQELFGFTNHVSISKSVFRVSLQRQLSNWRLGPNNSFQRTAGRRPVSNKGC